VRESEREKEYLKRQVEDIQSQLQSEHTRVKDFDEKVSFSSFISLSISFFLSIFYPFSSSAIFSHPFFSPIFSILFSPYPYFFPSQANSETGFAPSTRKCVFER
jgi:hypothetical protein